MRVAVLLTGQPRTFETAAPGILRYFSKANPDYFIHVWNHDTTRYRDAEKKGVVTTNQVQKETFNKIVKFYNPISIKIDEDKKFIYSSTLPQLYSLMHANNLKKNYELVNEFQYDIVVKCRFDLIWNHNLFFDPVELVHNSAYFSWIDNTYNNSVSRPGNYPFAHDRIYYANSIVMDHLANQYNNCMTLLKRKPSNEMICSPEALLYKYCRDSNIQMNVTNAHETIVRHNASGLHHITDYHKINKIHEDFYIS